MIYLFPFEQIGRKDRIVIYGAGVVGQQFLKQLDKTRYCSVIAMLDQKSSLYMNTNFTVFPVDKILSLAYDKIVIAINNPNVASNVRETLIRQYSIPEGRIVMGCNRKLDYEDPSMLFAERNAKIVPSSDNIAIAFCLNGGLGDIIIGKVFVESFMKSLRLTSRADIYTLAGRVNFTKAVFDEGSEFIDKILIKGHQKRKYDLVFSVSYGIRIIEFQEKRIRALAPALADEIVQLQERIRRYGVDFTRGSQHRIHFDRCRALGYTCYTAYNYYNICKISDWHIKIPLLDEYKSEYEKLRLKKYITVNLGWGLSDGGSGKTPSKVWPLERYNDFVRLCKETFRDIQIIQLGLENTRKITGIDSYIFGESLELVKYILKGSLLHIDCEGGLVHLATQLGTKCVVLFGPTPIYYFGYKENINIVSPKCNDCYYMYDDVSICARGMENPECMCSITPKMVMDRVEEYLMTEDAINA